MPEKASSPIVSRVSGKVTFLKDGRDENALSPILTRPERKVTLVSALQFSKAKEGIDDMVPGRSRLVISFLELKTFDSKDSIICPL